MLATSAPINRPDRYSLTCSASAPTGARRGSQKLWQHRGRGGRAPARRETPPAQPAARVIPHRSGVRQQQMVQFAGHHRAKVLNPPAVGFDPFAMGAGHDVHRRRASRRAPRSCVSSPRMTLWWSSREVQSPGQSRSLHLRRSTGCQWP